MEKFVITAAITGGASPESKPYLPTTPKEQVQATIDCYNAGAALVLIHARNPETGKGEQKTEWFEQAIIPVREKCDMLINVTTGGSGNRVEGDWLCKKAPEESVKGRVGVVPELWKDPMSKSDLASFNAGSSVIDIYNRKTREWLLKFVMVHSLPDMVYVAETMKIHGVRPELECYDIGMIHNAKVLSDLGHIDPLLYF
jgi:3-keto-5-aminohexanoate cleavage enzyme